MGSTCFIWPVAASCVTMSKRAALCCSESAMRAKLRRMENISQTAAMGPNRQTSKKARASIIPTVELKSVSMGKAPFKVTKV